MVPFALADMHIDRIAIRCLYAVFQEANTIFIDAARKSSRTKCSLRVPLSFDGKLCQAVKREPEKVLLLFRNKRLVVFGSDDIASDNQPADIKGVGENRDNPAPRDMITARDFLPGLIPDVSFVHPGLVIRKNKRHFFNLRHNVERSPPSA